MIKAVRRRLECTSSSDQAKAESPGSAIWNTLARRKTSWNRTSSHKRVLAIPVRSRDV
jgi:hypothetical protein